MAQNKLKKADVNASTWTGDTFVFATSPTLVTPVLGVATATSINGATITSGTLNGSVTGTNTGDQTSVSGNAWTATALATPRAIYGNNFDGSAALTQVIASTYGGTGNGFTKIAWPTTAEKTITIPDANMTITVSAATVLDDTTVADMVNTLGGATSTGTGGLVRTGSPALITPSIAAITVSGGVLTLPTGATDTLVSKNSTDTLTNKTLTSPTLTTPALGTPASGVLTNCTWLPTAWLVDDAITLAKMASGTAWNLITYDASGNPAAVVTGTAWQVLTSNGAGAAPTMQTLAASTPTPTVMRSTCFENSARFTKTNTGAGNTNFNTSGIELATSITSTSSTSMVWVVDQSGNTVLGSPIATISIYCGNFGDTAGTRSSFFGIWPVTVTGSGHTYTVDHAGFKILLAGGVYSLYATQANGTTENASSALTTVTTGDALDLIIKINSTTSIDYYWRKNGGALSSATNLTSNMPRNTVAISMQFSVSNNATANYMTTVVHSSTYAR